MNEIWKNNTVAGGKYWNGRTWLTVPRWKSNVPSTLNELITNEEGNYVFKPWPSWEMNKWGDCTKLQYIQSMEIDDSGVMWAIDAASPATVGLGGEEGTCP